jgi:hypothetical protein
MRHLLGVLVATGIGFVTWLISEQAAQHLAEFIAIFIALLAEVIFILLIEAIEFRKQSADFASRQGEIKVDTNSLTEQIRGLNATLQRLEHSTSHGLFATELSDPAGIWTLVLDDARKARDSIYVAITVPNFSAPQGWDDQLATYLQHYRAKTGHEVRYKVAVYLPMKKLSANDIRRLKDINDTYRSKGLERVEHGFVDQTAFFNFSIVVIDRKGVGFVWDARDVGASTKGIYFKNAPDLATELASWFVASATKEFVDVQSLNNRERQA